MEDDRGKVCAMVHVYYMQTRSTGLGGKKRKKRGEKKEVEQKGNGWLWFCVVLNSHSYKDYLRYAKVKGIAISCALPICLGL